MRTKPIFLFNADGGSGGAAGGGEQKPNAGGSGGSPAQEELNRQFADRAKRAEEAERNRLLAAMGVQSEEDLKKLVDAQRQADEARKTDMEKAADRAKVAEENATRLEAKYTGEIEVLKRRIVDGEIKMLAGRSTDKRGAFRPDALEDVLVLLDRSKVVEQGGKLTGLEDALEALAKAKPWMLVDDGTKRAAQKGTPTGVKTPNGQSQAEGNETKRPRFSL